MYTYLDTDDNKVLQVDISAGNSFWDKGGWTASSSSAPPVAAEGAKKNSTGAKYRHERAEVATARAASEMGPVDNPWRGQGPNAPFDSEFHFILNLAVGGTNGYFPDGEGGKMWSDQSTTAFQDFNNALPSVVQTWTSPALQVRRILVTDDV
jgi:hypothetical protein